MKKNLSKITLGVVLSSFILIGIIIASNDTNMKIEDVKGNKSELGDVSIISQEGKGLYNTKETVLSKDGFKVKKIAKGLPGVSKYSKNVVENRNLFNSVHDSNLIYEDKESIGYLGYISTDYYASEGAKFNTKITDKNLKTNKITEFDIDIINSSEEYDNARECCLVIKYKNEIYLAIGITNDINYDKNGNIIDNRNSSISIYKIGLENQKAQLFDEIKIKENVDISNGVSFVNNNKIYFMAQTYKDSGEQYLVYYDLENNKFDYIKDPVKIKEKNNSNDNDTAYSIDDNKLNIIYNDSTTDKKSTIIHQCSVDLEKEKVIENDKVYKIDKINENSQIRGFRVLDNKIYLVLNSYKEEKGISYISQSELSYNIVVLDEKTKKVLYIGQSKQEESHSATNYIVKNEEL
ncbi:hypothetical protein [Clostridium sp. CCUG 7971]|uniref:hypothetical protein n=1 Tax=Clostridium sp. CCUG 7971 TaxID=2811414 RepID=UPI001ABA6405|nr:hypothetical protein [Clostridium sp. CCUG 7971]MBO3446400.1 hypothetical protein [Clostridium sp. CCUG 7971]